MKFVRATCIYLLVGTARSLWTTGMVLIIAWAQSSSARKLIEEGYLLDEDLDEIVRSARRSWNYLVEGDSD